MNTIRSVLMCMPNLPTASHMFYHRLAIPPKKNINKILKGLALRLRGICDSN